jgi:lysylphosphatidylglycerol synthetase-like protein (DUF2156 family)
MPEWLYDSGPNGLWVFVLVTLVMGGLAAYATGSAIATTWRPRWQLFVYSVLVAAAVRFIHHALFQEPFLAPRSFLFDLIVLNAATSLGFWLTRGRQMRQQYDWLFASGEGPAGKRADV